MKGYQNFVIAYECARGDRLLFTPWWEDDIEQRDRDILAAKFDLLSREGVDKCKNSNIIKWLGGDLYKFHQKGTVELRPVFCKGLVSPATAGDLIFLLGVTKKNDREIPSDPDGKAAAILAELRTGNNLRLEVFDI